MTIKFGKFELQGDFILKDIRDIGMDRDFFIDPGTSVVNLNIYSKRIQITGVNSLLFRASAITDEVTLHFLSGNDMHSSIANFSFTISEETVNYKKGEFSLEISVIKDT